MPQLRKKELFKQKVIVVMPGYNVAKTLERTVKAIPRGLADKIVLVDDGSKDETSKIGRKLGLIVIEHRKNKGYGGAQKTGYLKALDLKADIVVMIHPDFQYDPTLANKLVEPIKKGKVDIMLGTRIRSRKEALKGGMPLYKYLSNRFLTITENIILGLNLREYHTGYRCYTRKVLETLPFNKFSNDYVFDSHFLVSAAYSKFKIGEIHVPVKYFPEAGSISFSRSVKYGLTTLTTLLQYIFQKLNIEKSPIFAKSK